jgi:hypothetical protein
VKRRVFVLLAAVLLVAGAAVYVSSVLADGNDNAGEAAKGAPNSSCPTDPLPLQADSLGPSSRAALAAEPAKGEPRVVAAIWASRDRDRGDIARNWCGKRTWRRTVVVTIDRRAYHPSVSASLGVYFVSRLADGYRAWGQPH